MKRKIIAYLTLLALVLAMIPLTVTAGYTPPANVGAPENLTVQYREDGFENTWIGFDVNISASDELRAFVDVIGADDSAFYEAGFGGYELMAQIDYKVDDGSWHYKSQWDDDWGYNTNKSLCRIEKGNYSSSVVFDERQFESISSDETLAVNRSYFDAHTMHFRVRFVVNYQDENGEYFGFFSPWSETVSYSNNQKVEDPTKLINHAPVLKSAELKKHSDGSPYLNIRADKAHEETQLLNNISNGWVKADVWLRVNNGEWKSCHSDNFVEEFNIGAEAYFGLNDNYDAAVYEIKVRYVFDNYHYSAAGKSGVIYSPFSNIISHGMAAYSNASNWAKGELDKASEYDLIPKSLKGADMTKPITREEFAELAVKLYEKTTGTVAAAATQNPFADTKNPEILKAFKVGVTTGTSATTFAPKELTNREQVATMLSRAIRVMAPGGDFSTVGAPVFTDQKDISSWALEHVKFMSKSGIIKGSDGKFMPKAVTTAQTAAGYATTTREQAIAMSVRSFEQFKDVKAIPSSNNTPEQNDDTKVTVNEPIQSEEPKKTAVNGMPSPNGGGLSGVWMGYYVPIEQYSPTETWLIMYEDGTFYDIMPLEGLEDFDRVKSQNDEDQKDAWGKYTFNGKTGTWKYNRTTAASAREMELTEEGNLKISIDTYYKLESVDGMHLEGAWTTYAYPEDPDLGKGGLQPIIRFTKEGRFKDEGLFVTGFRDLYVRDNNGNEVSAGEGSYKINDYTMTLNYDNGQVFKVAFSLNLKNKPELSPDLVFIHRMRMWKTNF